MSRAGFETTIPVFKSAKRVNALYRVATVIGLGKEHREDKYPENIKITQWRLSWLLFVKFLLLHPISALVDLR
jgi:hypothetical protein